VLIVGRCTDVNIGHSYYQIDIVSQREVKLEGVIGRVLCLALGIAELQDQVDNHHDHHHNEHVKKIIMHTMVTVLITGTELCHMEVTGGVAVLIVGRCTDANIGHSNYQIDIVSQREVKLEGVICRVLCLALGIVELEDQVKRKKVYEERRNRTNQNVEIILQRGFFYIGIYVILCWDWYVNRTRIK